MKNSKKITRNKKSSANRSSVNRFKAGQKVKYDGKSFVVKRAYVYHDKPFCVIGNQKQKRVQVSANSLK